MFLTDTLSQHLTVFKILPGPRRADYEKFFRDMLYLKPAIRILFCAKGLRRLSPLDCPSLVARR